MWTRVYTKCVCGPNCYRAVWWPLFLFSRRVSLAWFAWNRLLLRVRGQEKKVAADTSEAHSFAVRGQAVKTGARVIDRLWGHLKQYIPKSAHAKCAKGLNPLLMKYAWVFSFEEAVRKACGRVLANDACALSHQKDKRDKISSHGN